MNVISVLQKDRGAGTFGRRPRGRAGRLGLQLPGRGLRLVHDGDQRPHADGVQRAGRSAARRQSRTKSNCDRCRKFPVLRDLLVDRTRLFDGLKKIKGWVPVDGYYHAGPGPAPVARAAADDLPDHRVHQLRLLPGGLPAVQQDRAFARAKARPTSSSRRRQATPTTARFSARRSSLRRCASTTTRRAR